MISRSLIALTLFLAFLSGSSLAWADRVSRLIQILETDPSYKVRLQAVIALGKIKDKRSVPSLIKSLTDEHYTVRGVSAAALSQIGDKRALAPLKRMMAKESNSFARSQAQKAINSLSGGGGGEVPSGAKFFVTVGKLSNKASKGGKRMADILGSALLKEFTAVPGVVTDWGGRNPSGRELSKKRVKGFVLDGAILDLTVTQRGSSMEISCNIKVSLATYPGNSMKAFYTGGASTEVSASSFRPQYEDSLFKDVIEGAAQGAKQHIVQSYLNMQ